MQADINATPAAKLPFDDNQVDTISTCMDPTRSSETGCGFGMNPSALPNPRPSACSDSLSTKASYQTKKLEPIVKSSTDTDVSKNSCLRTVVSTISENASTSSSTSTSIGTSTATGFTISDAKLSDSCTTASRGSSNGNRSDSIESATSARVKWHTGGDCRWESIQLANARESPIGLSHFKLLKRLGYGDIGSVYLVELRGCGTYFAMKMMDKASMVSRNKLLRAQTEREILSMLDHPFLPTLYSHFETEKFYCLVMEYCSGGNLHSLQQKQPNKYFSEQAAK